MFPAESDVLDLLARIREDEPHALVRLLDMYKPLIESNIAKYRHQLEEDDIRQLSAIGLFEAACSYDQERSEGRVTFGLYAKVCIHNRLVSELRRMEPVSDSMEDELSVPEHDTSPEDVIIAREDAEQMIGGMLKRLTPYETKVLKLYLAGDSYMQIAQRLGKTRKSVDNAMTRIRAKFREEI